MNIKELSRIWNQVGAHRSFICDFYQDYFRERELTDSLFTADFDKSKELSQTNSALIMQWFVRKLLTFYDYSTIIEIVHMKGQVWRPK